MKLVCKNIKKNSFKLFFAIKEKISKKCYNNNQVFF